MRCCRRSSAAPPTDVSVLAASGKTFTVEAADMPSGRGDGAPVNTLVNSGSDDIVWMGAGDPQRRLLMNSSAGLGFLCKLGDLATKTRQGKDFMKVDEGASAQPPAFIPEKFPLSRRCPPMRGCCVFPIDEIPERPNGGVGVQLIALPESEQARRGGADRRQIAGRVGHEAEEPGHRDPGCQAARRAHRQARPAGEAVRCRLQAGSP